MVAPPTSKQWQSKESAVVDIQGKGAGGEDEVKACIAADSGKAIGNVTLLDFCAEHIPRFAVSRYIEVLEALLKSSTGKIQKEQLRQNGLTDRTWDRNSAGYRIVRRV